MKETNVPDEVTGCHYCGTTDDLRPYGPGGAMVCFKCATATPEREAEAKEAFGVLIGANEAVSSVGVAAIGQPSGPVPFEYEDWCDEPMTPELEAWVRAQRHTEDEDGEVID